MWWRSSSRGCVQWVHLRRRVEERGRRGEERGRERELMRVAELSQAWVSLEYGSLGWVNLGSP